MLTEVWQKNLLEERCAKDIKSPVLEGIFLKTYIICTTTYKILLSLIDSWDSVNKNLLYKAKTRKQQQKNGFMDQKLKIMYNRQWN